MQISRIFPFLTPSCQHLHEWCGVGLSIWLLCRKSHTPVGMDSDFANVTCTLCNFESVIQYPQDRERFDDWKYILRRSNLSRYERSQKLRGGILCWIQKLLVGWMMWQSNWMPKQCACISRLPSGAIQRQLKFNKQRLPSERSESSCSSSCRPILLWDQDGGDPEVASAVESDRTV